MITFSKVSKEYEGHKAVSSLDFTINEGEFFVLIGPSGCGKTTTLKMINRLIEASTGHIMIDEKDIYDYDIHQLRYEIGYVLQQIALFPHMTIEENISIVPELKKWESEKVKGRVTELLELVGLDPDQFRMRKPKELSGGQQQRIGVARALAADPKLILMDEPFSALDPITREKLQDDLLDLKQRIKKTIVFVTHDISEAMKLGDRIAVMNEGAIVQVGTPQELIQSPAKTFVEDFIGLKKKTEYIDLIEILQRKPEGGHFTEDQIIPSSISLEDLLLKLAIYESLLINEEGKELGMIDRKTVIAYLADRMSSQRSLAHE
ncbi:ABC transporter ATP-binding protein [Cytobacillus purgationiresistens]|uniref:Quaternary amine transport ATP-binding protein n=1 Tax=Cytobacillus purgationiresistens TaxID=863449 RepID=A0ABU0APA9_9BACI|nr:ABC transporter ATP-binding protein [Cytobacillus purgationiresistens]MDQ0272238.1 osmoprotectant transport system ATP-binding protein [Cytobacillus purgationiresistens]